MPPWACHRALHLEKNIGVFVFEQHMHGLFKKKRLLRSVEVGLVTNDLSLDAFEEQMFSGTARSFQRQTTL